MIKVGDKVRGNSSYYYTDKNSVCEVVSIGDSSANVRVLEHKDSGKEHRSKGIVFTVLLEDLTLIHSSNCDTNEKYKIVISSNGKDTKLEYYKDGKIIKETNAKLNADDEFSLETEVNICLERLFKKKLES